MVVLYTNGLKKGGVRNLGIRWMNSMVVAVFRSQYSLCFTVSIYMVSRARSKGIFIVDNLPLLDACSRLK